MRTYTLTAALLVLAGCDPLGGYGGPDPSTAPITAELAVIRRVDPLSEGITRLALDRLIFVERDPSSVDRVVLVHVSPDTAATFVPPLAAGDTVRFSSTFWFRGEGGGDDVPNWKINDYWEPPIAYHRIKQIERL